MSARKKPPKKKGNTTGRATALLVVCVAAGPLLLSLLYLPNTHIAFPLVSLELRVVYPKVDMPVFWPMQCVRILYMLLQPCSHSHTPHPHTPSQYRAKLFSFRSKSLFGNLYLSLCSVQARYDHESHEAECTHSSLISHISTIHPPSLPPDPRYFSSSLSRPVHKRHQEASSCHNTSSRLVSTAT